MEIILKSMLCLLILLGFYRLLLQRETMYHFNRFYLLIAVFASFIIPFNMIEQAAPELISPEETVAVADYDPVPSYAGEQISSAPVEIKLPFDWMKLVWIGYGVVSMILLIRFIRNIQVLRNKVKQNIQIIYRDQVLVILKEDSLPFSFLNYIFVAKTDFDSGKFTDEVFEHERTHVVEKHSWDILFIEVLLVPFWFHPGLYLAKQAIKLNHEFIADQVALQKVSITDYQEQLLRFATNGFSNSFVSSLNFSLTKKRLEMMTIKTKPANKWLKLAFLIPVLGMVIYLFSEKVDGKSTDLSEKADLSLSNDDSSSNTDVYTIVYGRQLTRSATGQFQRASSTIGQLVNFSTAYNEYKNLTDEYQAKLDAGVHFIQKSESEQESLLAMFTALSGRYFRLSDSEKRQAGRPKHPFAPYLKIESDGKTVYKMVEDLTESERKQLPSPLPQVKESEELTYYNRVLNTYELNRNKGQHYIDKSEVAQKLAMEYYEKTQRVYALLPLEEKQLTKVPTHPFAPYVRIEKGLNSYFKLAKELTEEERKNLAC